VASTSSSSCAPPSCGLRPKVLDSIFPT
jgi:hypothetical protein